MSAFDLLPESLTGAIFSLVGVDQGASITRVCTTWRRIFYEEPSLWHTFQLAPGPAAAGAGHAGPNWLLAKLGLLCRVAPHVQELYAADSAAADVQPWRLTGSGAAAQPPLAAVLLQLSLADHLTSFGLICTSGLPMPVGVVRQIARMSRLQTLKLTSRCMLPHEVADALGTLPALHTLCCRTLARPLPEELIRAVTEHLAPTLTELSLTAYNSLVLSSQSLEQLTALHRLHTLTLNAGAQEGLRMPSPAQFSALQRYDYLGYRYFEVEGALLAECSWKPRDARYADPSLCGLCGNPGQELCVANVSRLPSLARLLTALQPRGSTGPDFLCLRGLTLDPVAMLGPAPCLACVTELLFHGCDTPDFDGCLGTLLSWMPRVAHLSLDQCTDGELPECVCNSRGLRCLELDDNYSNKLAGLRAGPYLQTLEHLSVTFDESVVHLPPELAAATALVALDVDGSVALELARQDVELLAQLPRLRTLHALPCKEVADMLKELCPELCLVRLFRDAHGHIGFHSCTVMFTYTFSAP